MNVTKFTNVLGLTRSWQGLSPYKCLIRNATYRVRIHTGGYRGSGTEAKVQIKLYGSLARSEPIFLDNTNLVGSTVEKGIDINSSNPFGRSNISEFLLEVDNHLGRLKQIKIGHDNTGFGGGWYLSNVVIVDIKRHKKIVFPSNQWFGMQDSTLRKSPSTRILIPASDSHDMMSIEAKGKPLQLRASAMCFPHPIKVKKGERASIKKYSGYAGEDAYFIGNRKNSNTSQDFIGIADGVAEWVKAGIDAGKFSRSLMEECNRLVDSVDSDVTLKPSDLISSAVDHVHKKGILGSTTVCLVATDPDLPLLHSAYIGDSGYLIIRRTSKRAQSEYIVVYRSPEQEKMFGCPFQLGHHETSDSPSDCLVMSHAIEVGDVVVVGSDGLFDNLADDKIAAIVTNGLQSSQQRRLNKKKEKTKVSSSRQVPVLPQEVARQLCFAAFEAARDKKTPSPWSCAATEELHQIFSGGKQDDITVVVGFVEPQEL